MQLPNPDMEIELAMIAGHEPDELGEAVDEAFDEESERKRELQKAKVIYESELNVAASTTTDALRLAADDLMKAEGEIAKVKPATDLANGIRNVQDRLAWPMRTTVTILAALVIGLGSATYEVETNPDVYKDIPAKKARNYGDLYTKSPAAIAIITGIIGGAAGNFIGAVMSPWEARRRARRIIKKA